MMSWTLSRVALDDAKVAIMGVLDQQEALSPEDLLKLVSNQPNVSVADARRAMRVLIEAGTLRLDRDFHVTVAEPNKDMVQAG
jgi:Fe2+ or Zn2+ uptake regulation protein